MRILLARFVVVAALVLGPALVHADSVCSDEEVRKDNAKMARAKAAENAEDLETALSLAQSSFCADGNGGQAVVERLTRKLGSRAESRGDFGRAFEYFESGQYHEDAKRVGLAQLRAHPGDFSLSTSLLGFVSNHEFRPEEQEILKNARAQAARLLAEEKKAFAPRSPQLDLLGQVRDWLRLAGDEVAADAKGRAIERGDSYAAQDHVYALEQALSYYEFAGREDKQAEVRTKARRLAEPLAGGENWASAVALYRLAGDEGRAEELQKKREASAEQVEKGRQDKFKSEQDDLEKELGL